MTSYTPGSADTTVFDKDVVAPVLGDTPNPRKRLNLRKLHTEAFTMYAADMKRKVMQPENEDKPRQLAPAERKARMDLLRKELVGVNITGNLEPGHVVVDKYVDMQERGILRILDWSDMITREQELRNVKRDELWMVTGDGFLKRSGGPDATPTVAADTSTEARLRFTLQRRGIAGNLARLWKFTTHERIIDFLMREYCRDPPPGFANVTPNQVYQADKEIFIWLMEKTEGELDVTALSPGHEYPLDKWIPVAIDEWRIKAILTPFQLLPGGNRLKRELDSDTAAQVQREIKKMRGQQQQQQAQSKGPKKNPKAAKGQGKRQAKASTSSASNRMPKRLLNMQEMVHGEHACYAFNLEGCSHKGARCAKGIHACMVPGCGSYDHGVAGHK